MSNNPEQQPAVPGSLNDLKLLVQQFEMFLPEDNCSGFGGGCNGSFFETLIMLIIIIWLLRWLFSCGIFNCGNCGCGCGCNSNCGC